MPEAGSGSAATTVGCTGDDDDAFGKPPLSEMSREVDDDTGAGSAGEVVEGSTSGTDGVGIVPGSGIGTLGGILAGRAAGNWGARLLGFKTSACFPLK